MFWRYCGLNPDFIFQFPVGNHKSHVYCAPLVRKLQGIPSSAERLHELQKPKVHKAALVQQILGYPCCTNNATGLARSGPH
jgi:hypothetical protein